MARGYMKDPPPNLIPGQLWDVPGLIPEGGAQHHMPDGGLTGEGDEPQRTPGTLHAPPCAGHISYTGVRYQTPPALPQL